MRGRFIRIPEVLALCRVHDASQTFAGFDESRAQEPVLVVSRLFEMQDLPQRLLRQKSKALSNANWVCAQLNFRAGRVRVGFRRLRGALLLYPWSLFTVRNVRRLLNALFTRFGHKSLHRLRLMFDRIHLSG